MRQIRFSPGLCPRCCWESSTLPQIPYLDLSGPTSKRGEGRERKWREGEREEGRGCGKGRKREAREEEEGFISRILLW